MKYVETDRLYLSKGNINKLDISDNVVKYQFPWVTSVGQQEAANEDGMQVECTLEQDRHAGLKHRRDETSELLVGALGREMK